MTRSIEFVRQSLRHETKVEPFREIESRLLCAPLYFFVQRGSLVDKNCKELSRGMHFAKARDSGKNLRRAFAAFSANLLGRYRKT